MARHGRQLIGGQRAQPVRYVSTVVLHVGRLGAGSFRRPAPGDSIGSISFPDIKRGAGEDEYIPIFSRIEDARQVYERIARMIARAPSDRWS